MERRFGLSRCCARPPVLVLVLVLVLWAPGWTAAGARPPVLLARSKPPSKLPWRDQQLLLPSRGGAAAQAAQAAQAASSLPVARAAQAAVHYFNYNLGSPTSLRVPGHVKKASVKTIPGIGHKYFLQFSTKDFQTGQNRGTCLASVFYLKKKPRPVVEIVCKYMTDLDQRLQKDFGLYLSIQDSSEPSLDDFSALASIGGSYIAWEKSTEDVTYSMTQVKNVKLRKRADESLEFDYSVLLASSLSESLSCHMRVVWKLGQPLKVKYDCSPEEGSAESAEGSGAELGSASGFLVEPESNF